MGALVLVVCLYQVWTNPAAIRKQVLDKLSRKFRNARIQLDSAYLRLFGGIAVNEVRMATRDDLHQADFLFIPYAVLYHDKEQLLNGALTIRKIEAQRPRLRVVFQRDGHCNLQGLMAPPCPTERMPTLVLQQGTIQIEDDRCGTPGPLLEIRQVDVTVINDPLPIIQIEGSGQIDVLGPVQVRARLERASGAAQITLSLPAIPVGPALIERLAGLQAQAAAHLRNLHGLGQVQAQGVYQPGTAEPCTIDLTCQLHGGEFSHARLPMTLQQIEASFHCIHSLAAHTSTGTPAAAALRVPVAQITASSGPTRVEASLRDLNLPLSALRSKDGTTEPGPAEEQLTFSQLDWKVEHLPATPQLFTCLPEALRDLQSDYKPSGMFTVSGSFRQPAADQWQKRYAFQAELMEAEYSKFVYPLHHITGTVIRDVGNDHPARLELSLAGLAGNRPVSLRGVVVGESADVRADGTPMGPPSVDLEIQGKNITIDDKVIKALPARSQSLATQFHPEGQVDVDVSVHRDRGSKDYHNRYQIAFHDGALKYDLFPYRLEYAAAVLDIQGDRWICRDFYGRHGQGEIRGLAHSLPPPQGAVVDPEWTVPVLAQSPVPRLQPTDPALRIVLQGKDIVLDDRLEEAVAPPALPNRAGLRRAWSTLGLTGKMDFAVEVIDRVTQPQDIEVTVATRGGSMKPRFFAYPLDQVSATVRYSHDRVQIGDVVAHHGASVLRLTDGQVLLKPGGGFQARLASIKGSNVQVDTEFLAALPPPLKKGLEGIKLQGPIDLSTALVVDPQEPGAPTVVWWDGGAVLHDNQLSPGVNLKHVGGQISCCGRHEGTQLELVGNVLLEQADILGQPFRRLKSRLEVAPDSPDTLRFHDLQGEIFGGSVGGEARVEFGGKVNYEVVLRAVGLQLQQFGQHNFPSSAELQGPALLAVHVTGEAHDPTTLKGNGRLDVPSGKLYHLPMLLDLIKAFGLRMPDRTAFEQARMTFSIDGPQMQVHNLDLLGNAISLRGQGTLNLDGSNLNLDFSADWGRVTQLLPAGLNQIPRAITDQLFKIKVRGKVGAVKFEKELVPGVVEPLRKALAPSP